MCCIVQFYSQKQISRLLISDVFLAEIVLQSQNPAETAGDDSHEDDHTYMPPEHEVKFTSVIVTQDLLLLLKVQKRDVVIGLVSGAVCDDNLRLKLQSDSSLFI